MFDLIRVDLPNFPEEIIRDWLMHHIDEESWPPDLNLSSWRGILLKRPLDFWKKVKWIKVSLDLESITLLDESNKALKMMNDAYVFGQQNAFSDIGKDRFINSLIYLFKNGNFPKPILLLQENSIYEIADGHHRYLAWLTARIIYKQFIESKSEQKKDLMNKLKATYSIDKVNNSPGIQEVWIASTSPE